MSSTITIFHNPHCSKSRATLALLEAHGESLELIDYVRNPPSEASLTAILKKLNMKARDIVRVNEDVFKTFALDLDDEPAVLKALVQYPILIERPIVIRGDRAVIGRPPENVNRLF